MLRRTRLAATAAVLIPITVATGSGARPTLVSADLLSGVSVAADGAPPAAPESNTWATPATSAPLAQARPALAAAGTVDALDIPITALASYQRAATIVADVQPECGLSWELLAAIARIESDHGRVGGSTLNADGTSSPAVRGPVLDGQGPLAAIGDTDAGLYDGNALWDRAIGPMQFLPSTWTVVGVDADGDGVRSADDLDDAALGAAVYLCFGGEHLDTPAGAQAALLRYNHSAAYVTRVLDVAQAYEQGRAVTPTGTSVESIVARGHQVPTGSGTAAAGPAHHGTAGKGHVVGLRPTDAAPKAPPTGSGPFVPVATDPAPVVDPAPTTRRPPTRRPPTRRPPTRRRATRQHRLPSPSRSP